DLVPLPGQPYDVAEGAYRSVDGEGFIAYGRNQDSGPWRYVGHVFPGRSTLEELDLCGPQSDEIDRHQPMPPGACRQRPVKRQHRPADDRRQQYELLKRSFAEFGPAGERFLKGLLQAHRQGKAQGRKILALRAHYHHHDLAAALERAVRYGTFSFPAVERI